MHYVYISERDWNALDETMRTEIPDIGTGIDESRELRCCFFQCSISFTYRMSTCHLIGKAFPHLRQMAQALQTNRLHCKYLHSKQSNCCSLQAQTAVSVYATTPR